MFNFIQRGDVTLFNGDCLEVMPLLPSLVGGDFDMVMADPPYGTTACKWDSIIPLDAMWLNLKALVKPNAAIVMTASQPFTTVIGMSNIKNLKYTWTWIKSRPGGHLQAKKMPLKNTEDVVVFYSNQCTYNPQGTVDCNTVKKNTSGRLKSNCFGKIIGGAEHVQTKTNYPRQTLEFPSENNKGKHPTQKPVALMEYLIKTYTNEGDTVLDFTMGSGTTGVACQNTGRKFVGIELDPDYFKIACERMGVTS